MKTVKQDLLELLDFAWRRLITRMSGLSDDEWSWQPVAADEKVSIRWRLDHLTATFTEPRNRLWLGRPDRYLSPTREGAASATDALEDLSAAYLNLRSLLGDTTVDLDSEIGRAAGQFANATRRSFVLHVADELIHHAAEAALLRDLYAGRASL